LEQVINVRGSFLPLINLAKKLNFENVAAATILGDGRIALIADIDEIVRSDAVLHAQPAEPKTLELAHA